MTRHTRNPELMGLVESMRSMRNDYDAAKKTRFKRTRTGVSPTGSGADYHYRSELAYFGAMETARDLFRNHPLIGQGIRRLISNILLGGFSFDARTGDPGADKELAAWRQGWADDPEQCDLAGEHNWRTMEKLTLQQVIVDGDVMHLPQRSGCLQQVEAHRLRTPRGTSRNVIHGVLLSEYRRRMEYWITKEDIDPMQPVRLVGDVRRYPVRDADGNRQVFHHYMPDRTSQTRGVTAFIPAIDTAGMGDDLMFAQLVKAQMSACVTLLRELGADAQVGTPGQGLETSTETRPDGTTRTLAGWQPGLEVFGFPGEKLNGFSPNVPNAEFFQHAMLILTIVAVNLDLPVAVLMLDPTQAGNFSSWRGAMQQARMRHREIQQWLIDSFHAPIYRWKVRHWMQTNPALQKMLGAPKLNPYGHRWQPRGWDYIEPYKDAKADELKVDTAQTSPRRRAAERGLDWDDITAEIVEDRSLAIERAFEKAAELSAKYEGLDATWRDLLPKSFLATGGAAVEAESEEEEKTGNVPARGGA